MKDACGLADYQLGKISDPLVVERRFDIVAKNENPATRRELMRMLQHGLADRCKLRLHVVR
jgi:uncharacterized protein (TIGR03435 family)